VRHAIGTSDSTRTLSKLFSFNGRIGRKTFAVRGGAAFAVVLLGQMALSAGLAIFQVSDEHRLDYTLIYVSVFLVIPAAFAYLSHVVRRLHDMGFSGYWTLAIILLTKNAGDAVGLVVSAVIFAWLALSPGDKLDNKYGTAPRAAADKKEK
jgi:uncharacterized membrane protein YhaH (DUF805 family)